MGAFVSRQLVRGCGLFVVALSLLGLRAHADDQLKKKDGTVIMGQILSVSGGQIMVQTHASNGGIVKLPYYVSDIASVSMAPPDAVAKAQGADPATTVATLEPVVKQFAGLPADWVVDAMAQLAQAYAGSGKPDLALSMFDQIDKLYPGSKYHAQAVAGKALLTLKSGQIDEAMADVQPLIDQANQNIAPSPSEGAMYANAFLVYGQALEAQKKPQQALEAYLTVTTMFYQNAPLAAQADQLAKSLRDANPGLGVD